MVNVWAYAFGSVFVVSLISFMGVLGLSVNKDRLRRTLLYLVAFSVGALLGDVFLHLLPETAGTVGFTETTSLIILAGILVSFVIEKFIHWGHNHLSAIPEHIQPYALMNVFGDALHNYLDGLIIGASYLGGVELGVASTLAVAFHEIPQELGDFGVLVHGGFSRKRALTMNFLIALTAVLGVATVWGLSSVARGASPMLIPFAAGTFLYIAASDLIPELHGDVSAGESVIQFLVLLAGIGAMWLLVLV